MASEFFQSPVYEKYGKIIANEQFGADAFTIRLQEKDTRLALVSAIESQVPMLFLLEIENISCQQSGVVKVISILVLSLKLQPRTPAFVNDLCDCKYASNPIDNVISGACRKIRPSTSDRGLFRQAPG